MPRNHRYANNSGCYHYITRGINKKKLFHDHLDFERYRTLIRTFKFRFAINIYHYCLMPNHVHMLIGATEIQNLSRFSHYLQRGYAHYYSKRYDWSGQVFRYPFKAISVEDDRYLLECGRYVEWNPVRAGIVKMPEDYAFSSYRFYSDNISDDIVSLSPAYLPIAETAQARRKCYREYAHMKRLYETILDRVILGPIGINIRTTD